MCRKSAAIPSQHQVLKVVFRLPKNRQQSARLSAGVARRTTGTRPEVRTGSLASGAMIDSAQLDGMTKSTRH